MALDGKPKICFLKYFKFEYSSCCLPVILMSTWKCPEWGNDGFYGLASVNFLKGKSILNASFQMGCQVVGTMIRVHLYKETSTLARIRLKALKRCIQ